MNPEHLRELTATIYGESGAFFVPKDWNMPKWASHWHSCMELTLVLSGIVRAVIDGETFEAKKDQAIIVPSCAVHSGECLTKDTLYRTVKIEVSDFFNSTKASSKCLTSFLERRVKFSPLTSDPEIVGLIKSMIEAGDNNQHFRVVADFYRLIDLLYTGSAAEQEASRSGDFYEILHYIEANLGSHLSTKTICERFNYNETYFCRKFKKHTGQSATKYILLHRLELACQLLRNEEKHVGDICAECGFTDFSYFSAAFKRTYGTTPSGFRKLLRSEQTDRPSKNGR